MSRLTVRGSRSCTLLSRNSNESIVVPVVGSGGVCGWPESVGRVCVGEFSRYLVSVAVKTFHT